LIDDQQSRDRHSHDPATMMMMMELLVHALAASAPDADVIDVDWWWAARDNHAPRVY